MDSLREVASPYKSSSLSVSIVGGGPSGLLLGILLHRVSAAQVTIYERNAPNDTFGFGVVFSDETLTNLRGADPQVFEQIEKEFVHWPTMDVVHRGRLLRSGGHGFAALSRKRLLNLLAARAIELGVKINYQTEVTSIQDLPASYFIVIGDGVNSSLRNQLADKFVPSIRRGEAKYIWFGTAKRFDQFTFLFAETQWGLFQAHVYPFSDTQATFIVETSPEVWCNAGLDKDATKNMKPGETDQNALQFCQNIFSESLNGNDLVGNNSRWLDFPTVSNKHWHTSNIVLVGDAAHTAHFSIGSGTKLAFEDSIALAQAIIERKDTITGALTSYEAVRRPAVASIQRSAATSQDWFENVARYMDLPSEQFAFQILTRSQRITYDNLFLRDSEFAKEILGWFHRAQPSDITPDNPNTPPMFYPFQLRSLRLKNRVVVSPMAQYCSVDGMPNDWHLVHLGSRAVGGAALVMTEMTCVSPEGRITPGCTGLWSSKQVDEWSRIVTFVHDQTQSLIGMQLGHSGRKGSTRVAWQGMDLPLESENWSLLAPSALPYLAESVVPKAMTRSDMDLVRDQFVHATKLATQAKFDLLEVHAAHGYLLSSFLSPITNKRQDEFGGSLENRMRYPLEVISCVRAAWPDHLPLSVRISATDWIDGGFDGNQATQFARQLQQIGVDIIDVSTGEVDRAQQPAYGRLYQTPFADRIRQEVGIPTMTVGGVSSVDDVNTIILAGRADLCLIARPHLVDPYWTLNAAIDQGYEQIEWPRQYLSGKTARRRDQSAI